jgi:hypothetical protein
MTSATERSHQLNASEWCRWTAFCVGIPHGRILLPGPSACDDDADEHAGERLTGWAVHGPGANDGVLDVGVRYFWSSHHLETVITDLDQRRRISVPHC